MGLVTNAPNPLPTTKEEWQKNTHTSPATSHGASSSIAGPSGSQSSTPAVYASSFDGLGRTTAHPMVVPATVPADKIVSLHRESVVLVEKQSKRVISAFCFCRTLKKDVHQSTAWGHVQRCDVDWVKLVAKVETAVQKTGQRYLHGIWCYVSGERIHDADEFESYLQKYMARSSTCRDVYGRYIIAVEEEGCPNHTINRSQWEEENQEEEEEEEKEEPPSKRIRRSDSLSHIACGISHEDDEHTDG